MMDKYTIEHALQVKSRYENELMNKPNVVGVGVGVMSQDRVRGDEACIVVMVDKLIPTAELAPQDRIPTELEGVYVDIQEVGRLSAQTTSETY